MIDTSIKIMRLHFRMDVKTKHYKNTETQSRDFRQGKMRLRQMNLLYILQIENKVWIQFKSIRSFD